MFFEMKLPNNYSDHSKHYLNDGICFNTTVASIKQQIDTTIKEFQKRKVQLSYYYYSTVAETSVFHVFYINTCHYLLCT